jgi:predicted amidohydrolase YtcJ
MLIRGATRLDGRSVDIRVRDGVIAECAESLPWRGEDVVIDAHGGAVLPGLHDHHIHLFALAASLESVKCGPPLDAAGLVALLRSAPGGEWVRGVGYHESVAGDIDAAWLDRALPDRPVRVQHRSGRLWVFNSAGLALLGGAAADGPLERDADGLTGRLYDGDGWLRARLGQSAPSLEDVSRRLAACGVTSVSDATAANDAAAFWLFCRARETGALRQHVAVMGGDEIADCESVPGCVALARKIHLHDGDYPEPATFLEILRAARAHGLQVAVHCVTEADLVFSLSLMEEAGDAHSFRIEHASVVPPALLARLAAAEVTVVTQPNFVAERGDAYLADIPVSEHEFLYRGAGLLRHGVKLAGGTDAPFGGFDPWAAMQAAVDRRTRGGVMLGRAERLSPEQALALFTTHWSAPGGPVRQVRAGAAADLCLLRKPWAQVRGALAEAEVVATVQDGVCIYGGRSCAPGVAGRGMAARQ